MDGMDRAREIYREEGAAELTVRLARHARRTVRRAWMRRFRGGLSSRPRIEPVAGCFNALLDRYFEAKHGDGTDVMAEDWDTLVLLDACRHDDFETQNCLRGSLERRISKGQDSMRFVEENFLGRELHDTVYVTANPHVKHVGDDVFHAVVDDPLSEWDEALQCVPPETVTEIARETHLEYPDKRIVVHYMQPHDPPIGPTAAELRETMQIGGPAPGDHASKGKRVMEAVADGEISVETARQAYRETLSIALLQVAELLADVDGKVVVTADHGELFGERPYPLLGELYEHYNHPKVLELCEVPWLVFEAESERRATVAEPPVGTEAVADDVVEEQLSALGYK